MWLFATGFFLACTLGCKMVGLFTFFTIGAAVIVDLWNLLDYKKGLSMVSVVAPGFDKKFTCYPRNNFGNTSLRALLL